MSHLGLPELHLGVGVAGRQQVQQALLVHLQKGRPHGEPAAGPDAGEHLARRGRGWWWLDALAGAALWLWVVVVVVVVVVMAAAAAAVLVPGGGSLGLWRAWWLPW